MGLAVHPSLWALPPDMEPIDFARPQFMSGCFRKFQSLVEQRAKAPLVSTEFGR